MWRRRGVIKVQARFDVLRIAPVACLQRFHDAYIFCGKKSTPQLVRMFWHLLAFCHMAAVAARQGKHVEALAASLKQAPSMVYCLESLSRVGSTATYIGFTVSPYRRLRQHNGEVTAGARRTRKRQPWSFVAVVRGFVSQTVGLQFEWACELRVAT